MPGTSKLAGSYTYTPNASLPHVTLTPDAGRLSQEITTTGHSVHTGLDEVLGPTGLPVNPRVIFKAPQGLQCLPLPPPPVPPPCDSPLCVRATRGWPAWQLTVAMVW